MDFVETRLPAAEHRNFCALGSPRGALSTLLLALSSPIGWHTPSLVLRKHIRSRPVVLLTRDNDVSNGGDVTQLGDGTSVRVRVERKLAVGPMEARKAWLSYQWSCGGGLPVVAIPRDGGSKRILAPLLLEETLEPLSDSLALGEQQLQYRVSGNGLLSSELEPDSHSATVRFIAADEQGTASTMQWDVVFGTRQRRGLWQAVTEQMVGEVADNLQSHVATPLLYTRRTQLVASSPRAALDSWISFIFDSGGGLPLLPPLPLGRGDGTGSGRARLIVPPFLKERIVHVDLERCELRYTVDNPGLLTYQVHTHIGRVRFIERSGDKDGKNAHVEMVWEVEVRPLRGWAPFVQRFTAAVVDTLARNLQAHLAEPGAVVKLQGPRGSGPSLGSVPKATWLGGVLSAHLSDRRPVLEQTISIFKPWTWGRAKDEVGDSAEWSDGMLSSDQG